MCALVFLWLQIVLGFLRPLAHNLTIRFALNRCATYNHCKRYNLYIDKWLFLQASRLVVLYFGICDQIQHTVHIQTIFHEANINRDSSKNFYFFKDCKINRNIREKMVFSRKMSFWDDDYIQYSNICIHIYKYNIYIIYNI